MELNTGSAISAIPIKRYRRIFPNHKMFLSDVWLRTATGENFKPLDM